MSDGLRALMAAAEQKGEPLSFGVTILAGQWLVGGRVAPAVAWHEQLAEEVDAGEREWQEQYLRTLPRRDRATAPAPTSEQHATLRRELGVAMEAETVTQDRDEVTLADVSAFPAVEQTAPGGRAGGLSVAVVRVPLTSINMWWVSQSKTIAGRSGVSGGVVFGF